MDAAVNYSTGEVARMCGISQQSAIRLCDTGELECFRVPKSKYRHVPRAGLIRFMARCGIPLGPLEPLSAEEWEIAAEARTAATAAKAK